MAIYLHREANPELSITILVKHPLLERSGRSAS